MFGIGHPPPEHILPAKVFRSLVEVYTTQADKRHEYHELMNYGWEEAGQSETRMDVAYWVNRQLDSMIPEYRRPKTQLTGSSMVLVGGVSQGMDVAFKTIISMDRGKPMKNVILVEDPSFFATSLIIRDNRGILCPVPTDLQNGIIVDKLRDFLNMEVSPGVLLCDRVAGLCVIPAHHNPCGFHYSLEKRQALIEIAHEFGFFIVADEVYGLLSFKSEDTYPFMSQIENDLMFDGEFTKDPECNVFGSAHALTSGAKLANDSDDDDHSDQQSGKERVRRCISISSLSKIIGGGTRVGWVHTLNEKVYSCLARTGHFLAGNNPVNSMAWLMRPMLRLDPRCAQKELALSLDEHLVYVRNDLALKAHWCVNALRTFDPKKLCSFVNPSGGYFLMVTTPVPTKEVMRRVEEKGERVAIVEGVMCSTRFNQDCQRMNLFSQGYFGDADARNEQLFANSFRLCFAMAKTEQEFQDGLSVLLSAVYDVFERSQQCQKSKV